MQLSLTSSHRGFTLIELIVGMTVFAIGLAGILALLGTTFSSARYSSHEVVVAGLLREQIELVKNIRDTNLTNYVPWDKVLIWATDTTWTGGIYTIENNYTTDIASYSSDGEIDVWPVSVERLDIFPTETLDRWNRTRLSLDERWRYTHAVTGSGTAYASYIIVSPLGYTGSTGLVPIVRDGQSQGWIIDARVIVKTGNTTREYDAKTMITDWVK